MTNLSETDRLIKSLTSHRKPNILYHYTSGSGLIGILRSGHLWASSIRFLNDSTEYELALNLARSGIEDRLQEVKNSYDEGVFRVLQQKLSASGAVDVYVSSFSENGDQLSQWRAYCPSAGGYAIGFSASTLDKPCPRHQKGSWRDVSMIPWLNVKLSIGS